MRQQRRRLSPRQDETCQIPGADWADDAELPGVATCRCSVRVPVDGCSGQRGRGGLLGRGRGAVVVAGHDRLHQTLKNCLDRQDPATDIQSLQAQLDTFAGYYNQQRRTAPPAGEPPPPPGMTARPLTPARQGIRVNGSLHTRSRVR